MGKLQFGDYIFKINPEKIDVTLQNHMAYEVIPFKGERVRQLGKGVRKAVCKGVFWGATAKGAKDELDRFLNSAKEENLLFLPEEEPFFAVVNSWGAGCSGDGRVIPYTIVFLEKGD